MHSYLATKHRSLLRQHSIKDHTTIILSRQRFHYRVERTAGIGGGMPICPEEEDRFAIVGVVGQIEVVGVGNIYDTWAHGLRTLTLSRGMDFVMSGG